ncbi:MAG: hypothetical protein MJZ99_07125 [Bacteroidales bacterium]|nr:hypothetical protein [Bacteroidales bacterium]
MKTERPDGDYIATQEGTWEKVVPVIAPTDMERVEAQVMYTALLTDTLLPEVE